MAALTLAVPSKGRMKEEVEIFFKGLDAALIQTSGARGYRATLAGFEDIEVMLLSASEIADSLVGGDIHLGITGHDLLLEQMPDLHGRVHLIQALGFGRADVVVAVPEHWVDVSTMADLDDVCAAFARKHRRRLRVATKITHLTRNYFARFGIADYRIVESDGATEAAPAAGTAEIIVDITTTGATLKANGLKVLDDGTILKSEMQLAASLRAEWTPGARAAAAALLARISARDSQVLSVRIDTNADAVLAAVERKSQSSVLSRPAGGSGEYVLLCPSALLTQAIASLRDEGCNAPATIRNAERILDSANPLFAGLAALLD